MSVLTIPTPQWYEEQQYLQDMGIDTGYYGGYGAYDEFLGGY